MIEMQVKKQLKGVTIDSLKRKFNWPSGKMPTSAGLWVLNPYVASGVSEALVTSINDGQWSMSVDASWKALNGDGDLVAIFAFPVQKTELLWLGKTASKEMLEIIENIYFTVVLSDWTFVEDGAQLKGRIDTTASGESGIVDLLVSLLNYRMECHNKYHTPGA